MIEVSRQEMKILVDKRIAEDKMTIIEAELNIRKDYFLELLALKKI